MFVWTGYLWNDLNVLSDEPPQLKLIIFVQSETTFSTYQWLYISTEQICFLLRHIVITFSKILKPRTIGIQTAVKRKRCLNTSQDIVGINLSTLFKKAAYLTCLLRVYFHKFPRYFKWFSWFKEGRKVLLFIQQSQCGVDHLFKIY